MTRTNLSIAAMLTAMLLTGLTAPAGATVIADFDGSTAGTNLSASNLNAGSPGGTWTVNQPGALQDSKIQAYSDAPGNHQLQIDGEQTTTDPGVFEFQLDFDSAVALNGTWTVSWDMLLRRVAANQAAPQLERSPLIVAYDSLGATLFEIKVYGHNGNGTTQPLQGAVIVEGQSPSSQTVGFLSASSTPATSDMTDISVVLGTSTFDVLVGGVTAYSGICV